MNILGIETSCDETAAAVVADGRRVLSNVVASSLPLHAQTGGIVPETAAREQLKYITPVTLRALADAGLKDLSAIDAVAVTAGPGLFGSLIVGVTAARALAWFFNKPLIPVNHLAGHLYAAYLGEGPAPQAPLLFLVVSGGHTQLLILETTGRFTLLGGTLDDAAGEAFDKVARLLNLNYPGGPAIEQAAASGDPSRYPLPRPMITADNFNFSFSGLKTAVLYRTRSPDFSFTASRVNDLAASFQQAVVDVLVAKTVKALAAYRLKTLVAAGGVLANKSLRAALAQACVQKQVTFHCPPPEMSTDNAAGIAAAAFYHYPPFPWRQVAAVADLPLAGRT